MPRRDLIVLFLLAAARPQDVKAQRTIRKGAWSARVSPTGPVTTSYGDRIVARSGSFAGYRPGWKGTRLTMTGCALGVHTTEDAATATWKKSVPGNAEVTLTLQLTRYKAAFSADMTAYAAGWSRAASRSSGST